MPKTLLNSVNEVFKKVGYISGDSNALTSLTDSSRQPAIDAAVQAVNEGVSTLYQIAKRPKPNIQAEATITLAATRSYTLATGLIEMLWPLRDKTNSQLIYRYKGDYNDLLNIDIEEDDTGLPHFAVISPVDGNLYVDTTPAGSDIGNVYTYQYIKSALMSAAADQVPFNDDIWTHMVNVWAELWRSNRRGQFNSRTHNSAMSMAIKLLPKSRN